MFCKLQVYKIVIHNFKGYTSFLVIIKYWLCMVSAFAAAAAAKSLQSCLTLCDPIDGSPPGSSLTEIL